MNDAFLEGVKHFNNGDFFECHDEWEELWFDASGPTRMFLQGMIQIAVGYHHASNGNYKGAESLFIKGIPKLKAAEAASVVADLDELLSVFDAHRRKFTDCISDSSKRFDMASVPLLTSF